MRLGFKVFGKRKVNPLEELNKVWEKLDMAYAELLAARRFMRDRRVRRRMLVAAAATRNIFLTPDILGWMYVKSCISELRAASRKLRKLAECEELGEDVRLRLKYLAHMLANPGEGFPQLVSIVVRARRELDLITKALEGGS